MEQAIRFTITLRNVAVGASADRVNVVHFELAQPLQPTQLSIISPPQLPDPTKGVVLSGRGPIWLYAYLLHHYHPVPFLAVFDPRLAGAVVVASHHPDAKVGDIIRLGDDPGSNPGGGK